MGDQSMRESHFSDLKLLKRGKVRDIYEVEDKLLIVASDRVSAFDVIMEDPVPDKGRILTGISLFWFEQLKKVVDNHLVTADAARYPAVCRKYGRELEGRSMLVKRASPLPVECIVRGYISGSGWTEYQQSQSICGIPLPAGLVESQMLPEPLFTPSTKEEQGLHDQNISFERAEEVLGRGVAQEIRSLSLEIYKFGRDFAAKRGIIIADTKFEFGILEGRVILIDEVLTPDSSRFWPMDTYRAGGPQSSFDKQFLRDYLNSIQWPKKPPPPKLPEEVVLKTREKYLEAYSRLTGKGLE